MSKQNSKKKIRDRKAAAQAKLKEKENAKLPINQFLNAVTQEGKLKYKTADKLRTYFMHNPDPTMDAIRHVNALIHELRHHKLTAAKCFREYHSDEPVTLRDNQGRPMDRLDLYSSYIAESHTCHLICSKIRATLINKLLPMVDPEIFGYEDFDRYVLKCEEVVKELGYELFPLKVEVVDPK